MIRRKEGKRVIEPTRGKERGKFALALAHRSKSTSEFPPESEHTNRSCNNMCKNFFIIQNQSNLTFLIIILERLFFPFSRSPSHSGCYFSSYIFLYECVQWNVDGLTKCIKICVHASHTLQFCVMSIGFSLLVNFRQNLSNNFFWLHSVQFTVGFDFVFQIPTKMMY